MQHRGVSSLVAWLSSAGMQTLRTPEERFGELPDFGYEPHYGTVPDGEGGVLRMAWVENGPATGEPVLLLHGEPSWSFLYRRMLPVLAAAGLRAIAPDLVGFGRSDKPARPEDHSYARHVEWVRSLVFDVLDLRDVTLVCQDWGGPIGLRVLGDMPERFVRVIASNTLLPTCEPPPRGVAPWPGDTIAQWIHYSTNIEDMAIGNIVQGSCASKLDAAVKAAYDAPFPDARYKQGMLVWPSLIPLTEHDPGIRENRRTWEFLEQSDIPFITAFSDRDPTTAAWEKVFQSRVRGAQQQVHVRITQAGHMVQEDQGTALAGIILAQSFPAGSPAAAPAN